VERAKENKMLYALSLPLSPLTSFGCLPKYIFVRVKQARRYLAAGVLAVSTVKHYPNVHNLIPVPILFSDLSLDNYHDSLYPVEGRLLATRIICP
jgi:hypothetical protein